MQNLFSITNKVALVTGGSRGIGYMIAQGFVEAGAKTYISSRKKDVCDAAAEELSKSGACISIPADLSSEAGCRFLADEIAKRELKLDILVNNAGATWGAALADYPDDAFDKVMNLNVKGIFHLTRFLVPQLTAAGTFEDPSRVINIGSVDGLQVPATENYAYAASKAAVHQLTRVLAHQLAAQHITVNAIAPGPFETKMMAETIRRAGDAMRKGNPMGRIGTPEDMAGTAIFLSSRAAAYITGAVIPVDGGITTRHE